jgi:hypothetical protein
VLPKVMVGLVGLVSVTKSDDLVAGLVSVTKSDGRVGRVG